jgi:alanyl aminopeptidase
MRLSFSTPGLALALTASFLCATGAQAADDETVPIGRLPRSVVPTHVGIELKIDPAQSRFSGQVHMDVQLDAATSRFWMHGRDLNITSATFTPKGGQPVPLSITVGDKAAGVLRVSAAQPLARGAARIDIAYDAPFGQLQGAYKVKSGGDDYIVTQMEAIGARTAFPGFDEPSYKQPFDFSLEIPEALQGVANSRQIQSAPAEKGWKKLVFATTPALPTYLIAFAVGPWDIVDGPALAPNAVRKESLGLRGIAPRGQGPRMRYALEHSGEIVAALEDYFGLPYPFDKLDILAAPDFSAGAMENAGLIVYRDVLLYANEQSPVGLRQSYWGTHTHELAHQWFGDLVTMPWWDDVWLNEAFATWMATKIVGGLQPGFHADRNLMEGALRAMGQDSLASTRRIREPINGYTDIASAFDGITYQKGGAVLSMLERFVGAERFREGIRAYMRKHARGNATSADLVDAVAAASMAPADVRKAFASFLDQPGVPIAQIGVDCTGATPALKIDQRRFLPVGSTAPNQGVWQIPMCVRWADAGGEHSQCSLVGDKSATLALRASSCPAWVMPNASGAGYYRFALAAADAAKLEANFDKLEAREQRAYADSVAAALSGGAIDASSFLRAAAKLATVPERETATSPIQRLNWMLQNAADTPAERQALRDFARRLYAPRLATLGTEGRPGDSDDDRILRGELMGTMAGLGRDPALGAALAAKGRRVLGLQGAEPGSAGDGKLHSDIIAPDQRRLALHMAMEEGDAVVFDALLAQLASTQDPSLRGDLLGAAGSARQPELRARARALALAPDAIRRNEIGLVLGGRQAGAEPDAAQSLAQREWIDANYSSLLARVAPGGAFFVFFYSDGMCSAAEADAMQARFADRVKSLEGGPRTLAQAAEVVRLCGALKATVQAKPLTVPAL